MGSCMSRLSPSNSQIELGENVFPVTNVNSMRAPLWDGHLEFTRTEIILHRAKYLPMRWPLNCLRRYGCDLDVFTIEVGRRCTTGEGIFAFRSEHPDQLFQALQNCIQTSSIGEDAPAQANPTARTMPSAPSLPNVNATTNSNGAYILPNGSATTPNTDQIHDANYMEPIANSNNNTSPTVFETVTLAELLTEPRPANAPTADLPSLNLMQHSSPTNAVSNEYQQLVLRTTSRTERVLSLDIPPQEYAPSVVFPSPIQPSSQAQMIINALTSEYAQNNVFHDAPYPISPTQSSETGPTYINVKVNESTASTPRALFSDYQQNQILVHYSNSNNNITSVNHNNNIDHGYENFEPDSVRTSVLMRTQQRRVSRTDMLTKSDSVHSPTVISENSSEPSTPNNAGVNYIVLDLDQIHSQPAAANTDPMLSWNSSPVKNANANIYNTMSPTVSTSTMTHSVSSLLLPDSPQRKAFDYVTIDFNKTNALSNSISSTITECEGSRKTRHSSNVVPTVLPPAAIPNTTTPSSHSNSVSD